MLFIAKEEIELLSLGKVFHHLISLLHNSKFWMPQVIHHNKIERDQIWVLYRYYQSLDHHNHNLFANPK